MGIRERERDKVEFRTQKTYSPKMRERDSVRERELEIENFISKDERYRQRGRDRRTEH